MAALAKPRWRTSCVGIHCGTGNPVRRSARTRTTGGLPPDSVPRTTLRVAGTAAEFRRRMSPLATEFRSGTTRKCTAHARTVTEFRKRSPLRCIPLWFYYYRWYCEVLQTTRTGTGIAAEFHSHPRSDGIPPRACEYRVPCTKAFTEFRLTPTSAARSSAAAQQYK